MISVSVPCSCGEFVQGRIGCDEALISCPIDIYSTAIVRQGVQKLELLEKVEKAIKSTMLYYNIDEKRLLEIEIEIDTPLPYGKGYATSTSEMVAVIVAVSKYFGEFITPIEVARLCVEIEPTDSVMFKGIALFKHLKCELVELIDQGFTCNIAILELEDCISTVRLRNEGAFDQNIEDSELLFSKFILGLKSENYDIVRESMLNSALRNQCVLEKKYLSEINDMALLFSAIGINVAHSGSIIGVMFESEINLEKFIEAFKVTSYSKLYSKIRKTKVISGGWIINSECGGCNGSNN